MHLSKKCVHGIYCTAHACSGGELALMPSRILVLGCDVSVTIVLPGVVPLKSLGVPGKERSKVFNIVSLDALMIASWPGAIAIAHSNNECFRR